ncbi:uncharacterized protein LOC120229633 [Hyaena hyaena]|uniref:uncharacterized protein LOC120229633 n=1 Tax=Hyaena hyaena TaxID=95912 RepID=UPI0019232B9E|nr:uncharacterized protein LOC120229633 [Hyaena hyaena]
MFGCGLSLFLFLSVTAVLNPPGLRGSGRKCAWPAGVQRGLAGHRALRAAQARADTLSPELRSLVGHLISINSGAVQRLLMNNNRRSYQSGIGNFEAGCQERGTDQMCPLYHTSFCALLSLLPAVPQPGAFFTCCKVRLHTIPPAQEGRCRLCGAHTLPPGPRALPCEPQRPLWHWLHLPAAPCCCWAWSTCSRRSPACATFPRGVARSPRSVPPSVLSSAPDCPVSPAHSPLGGLGRGGAAEAPEVWRWLR